MGSDRWFRIYERLCNERDDRGTGESDEDLSEWAWELLTDEPLARADYERDAAIDRKLEDRERGKK
jgi:hypothetical protein